MSGSGMALSSMKWDIFLLLSIPVYVCQIIMFGVSLTQSLCYPSERLRIIGWSGVYIIFIDFQNPLI